MSFYRISVFTAVVAIFALFSLEYLQKRKKMFEFNIRKPSFYYNVRKVLPSNLIDQ